MSDRNASDLRAEFAVRRRLFRRLRLLALILVGVLLGIAVALPSGWPLIVIVIPVLGFAVADRRMVSRHRAEIAEVTEQKRAAAKARTAAVDAELDEFVGPAGVCVIIPAYNAQDTIATAIESVQRQSYANLTCVIVDDCSTDQTVEAALAAIGDDDRFTLLKLALNSGASVARNAGLAAASGEYLVYLDADDVLLADAIRRRLLTLRRKPQATGAFGRQLQVSTSEGWREMKAERMSRTPDNVNISTAGGDQPFIPHQVLMSFAAARDLAGFDEQMRNNMDFDHWMRSLRSGHEFVYCGYLDCIYVQLPDSIVGKGVEGHGRRFMSVLNDEWDGILDGPRASCGRDLDGPLGQVLRAGIAQMRYLRIAGMMIGVGQDPVETRERLVDIEPARKPLPHEYAITQIRYGIRREYLRAAGGDGAEVEAAALARAKECVSILVPDRQCHVVAPAKQPTWTMLVTSAQEARLALENMREVPGQLLPMFVCADSWIGDRGSDGGASSYLRNADRPVQSISLPGFFLQGIAYRTVVVSSSDQWLERTAADIAAHRGSVLRTVELESDELRLADFASPRGQVSRVANYAALDTEALRLTKEPQDAGSEVTEDSDAATVR
ncbi:MAG: glycosyltransferase family 2 protein [Candidatus Nanopelagicales bacterium]